MYHNDVIQSHLTYAHMMLFPALLSDPPMVMMSVRGNVVSRSCARATPSRKSVGHGFYLLEGAKGVPWNGGRK